MTQLQFKRVTQLLSCEQQHTVTVCLNVREYETGRRTACTLGKTVAGLERLRKTFEDVWASVSGCCGAAHICARSQAAAVLLCRRSASLCGEHLTDVQIIRQDKETEWEEGGHALTQTHQKVCAVPGRTHTHTQSLLRFSY